MPVSMTADPGFIARDYLFWLKSLMPRRTRASPGMPCADCGHWSFAYRQFSVRRQGGPEPAWASYWQNRDELDLYWYIRCVPSCRANAVLRELELVEQHLSAELRQLRRSIELAYTELRNAWWVLDQ